MARILVVDNYDSFVYNLVQYLGELGADVHVIRNDELTVAEIEAPFQPEAGAYGGGHHHHDDAADLHDPGHGPHRSVPRIHEFKPR